MAFDLSGFSNSGIGSMGSSIGGAVGLAGGLYSAFETSQYANEAAQVQQQILGLQNQALAQNKTAMEITSKRQGLQNIRQLQVTRAAIAQASANQGTQFSSAKSGAQATATSQASTNELANSQNLQIGENLFNIATEENFAKMQLSHIQSQEATSQAFGGLFGSLGKNMGSLFQLGSGLAAL